MTSKILISLFRVLIVALALCMLWGFWMCIVEGIVIVLPFMLGYLYVVIELARFKKWALALFLITSILSILTSIFFMATMDSKIDIEVIRRWFLCDFVFISAISMLIFGICAIVRWLLRK